MEEKIPQEERFTFDGGEKISYQHLQTQLGHLSCSRQFYLSVIWSYLIDKRSKDTTILSDQLIAHAVSVVWLPYVTDLGNDLLRITLATTQNSEDETNTSIGNAWKKSLNIMSLELACMPEDVKSKIVSMMAALSSHTPAACIGLALSKCTQDIDQKVLSDMILLLCHKYSILDTASFGSVAVTTTHLTTLMSLIQLFVVVGDSSSFPSGTSTIALATIAVMCFALSWGKNCTGQILSSIMTCFESMQGLGNDNSKNDSQFMLSTLKSISLQLLNSEKRDSADPALQFAESYVEKVTMLSTLDVVLVNFGSLGSFDSLGSTKSRGIALVSDTLMATLFKWRQGILCDLHGTRSPVYFDPKSLVAPSSSILRDAKAPFRTVYDSCSCQSRILFDLQSVVDGGTASLRRHEGKSLTSSDISTVRVDVTRMEAFELLRLDSGSSNGSNGSSGSGTLGVFDIVRDHSDPTFLHFAASCDKSTGIGRSGNNGGNNGGGVIDLNIEGSLRFQKRSTDFKTIVDHQLLDVEGMYKAQESALMRRSSEIRRPTLSTPPMCIPISSLHSILLPSLGDIQLMSTLEKHQQQNQEESRALPTIGSVITMCAHPTLPMYVAGSSTGHVGLWSFGQEERADGCLCEYDKGVGGRGVGGNGGKSGNNGNNGGSSSTVSSGINNRNNNNSGSQSPKREGGGSSNGTRLSNNNGGHGAAISRVRFNNTGDRIAAVDTFGRLRLWSVTPATMFSDPYCVRQCNARQATDVLFLDASTTVMTSGLEPNMSVCVWDTLLPVHSSLVSIVAPRPTIRGSHYNRNSGGIGTRATRGGGTTVNSGSSGGSRTSGNTGVTALLSVPFQNMIVAGSTNGQLYSYDVRMFGRGDMNLFAHSNHRSSITSLSYNSKNGCIASASKNGVVNVWSLQKKNTAGDGDNGCCTWSNQTMVGTKARGVLWWNDVSLLSWGLESKISLHCDNLLQVPVPSGKQ